MTHAAIPASLNASGLKAALYLRVSTGRQASSDLSIPDQKQHLERFCLGKGWLVAKTFTESGASATDDKRPEFQHMLDAACTKPSAFDVIVVHSFSRFFRDQFQLEFHIRKLAKFGVRLVSATQDLGDDPISTMIRQIMALFDEYQSKENGKHTLRAMNENARQGFWNGALAPIGYRIVTAGQRGAKVKKTLAIDPLQAETIRLIYRLALRGDGDSGPMGLKAIATYLNDRGIRTRNGGLWGVDAVHKILTRTTYIGQHKFNTKNHKTRARKPENEHAIMTVPPIISEQEYQAVQNHLRSRNPVNIPPRVVSGPTLLTGICFCSRCGGAMTLRTGKGGQYRYYTCSTKARQGKTGCTGLTVPMDRLDQAVINHIEQRLLTPQRLSVVLEHLLTRREDAMARRREHAANLKRQASEARAKIQRLYQAIEEDIADLNDPVLKARITELTAIRDQAQSEADRTEAMLEQTGTSITPKHLKSFVRAARHKLKGPDGQFRRHHLQSLAQRIEVISKTEARIIGRKDTLLQILVAANSGKSTDFGVRSFEPKWRTRHDSNV